MIQYIRQLCIKEHPFHNLLIQENDYREGAEICVCVSPILHIVN